MDHTINSSLIYVVDDDSSTRTILRAMLERNNLAVETYESADRFLSAYRPSVPACLFLDVVMPGVDGLELQRTLNERGYEIPIVFLSGASEIGIAVEALKAGAVDFLEKPIDEKRALDCIARAITLDRHRRRARAVRAEIEVRKQLLTKREDEVMSWIVKGKSNKQIARLLGISSRTVELHRSRVMAKMQVRTPVDLARILLSYERPISSMSG